MSNLIQTAPAVFQFQSQEVRTVDVDGETWFIAADVADVLGYPKTNDLTRNLEDYEKGAHNVRTLGGEQTVTIINESGIYSAALKSRKPEAKVFKKWVTCEVLPTIRKTGKYSLGDGHPSETEIAALLERVAELEDLVHILLQQRLATPKAQPLSDEDIHALTLQQWQANEDCKQFFLNIEILRVHHQLELNHSRDPEILAINLNQYMAVCDEFSLPNINILKLRRALKLNTRHLFLKATAVRSGVLLDSRGCGILMRCWLFRSKTGARRPRRRVVKMRGDNS